MCVFLSSAFSFTARTITGIRLLGPCFGPFAIELRLFDLLCPEEFSLIKQHSSILV